jgi:hypothetical protein
MQPPVSVEAAVHMGSLSHSPPLPPRQCSQNPISTVYGICIDFADGPALSLTLARRRLFRPKKVVVDLLRANQVFELLKPGECPILEHVLGHVDPSKQVQ